MSIEWPTVIQGGIPIIGGLYATALGFGWFQRPASAAMNPKLRDCMKWLGPLVIAFGLFTGWETHSRLAHPTAAELARSISTRLSFPVQVDEITTLDAVDGAGDTITYHSSINAALHSNEERARMKQALREQLTGVACSSADTAKLLAAGYAVEWRYRFVGTADELSLAFDSKSCTR
jgi:hypothetical protein